MREILFRGKSVGCVSAGKWVFGYYTRKNAIGDEYRDYIQETSIWNYAVDPDTVGQFTGLLDKNGNKIFEGDILKDKYIPEGKDVPKDKFNHIWLVTYERGAFCITNGHRSGTLFDPYAEDEIIGNKWDNPELLNP